MPFTTPHLYITWGGRVGTLGVDMWQCGQRYMRAGGLALTAAELPTTGQLVTYWGATLTTYWDSMKARISPGIRLEWVKAALIQPDGSYGADAVEYNSGAALAGTGVGGSGWAGGAPADALKITTWSGSKLGAHNYGGWFIPCPLVSQSSTNMKIGDTTTQWATPARTFLISSYTEAKNWGSGVAQDLRPFIMGENGQKQVQYVRVGDVIDTQRRRRNRIQESYFLSAAL